MILDNRLFKTKFNQNKKNSKIKNNRMVKISLNLDK